MKPYSASILIPFSIAASACQQQADAAPPTRAKTAATISAVANPIVVELYQSQGCSSCPPANAAVNAVADQPGIIALSFAVTYWDRLGWKDIFADRAYTQRQYDYAHAFGNPNVYTPQIVINGKTALTGIKRGELAKSIAASPPISGGPSISVDQGSLTIGKGYGAANIWLVQYDPQTHNIAIRSGENDGRRLPHKNIVRKLTKLGEWRGVSASFKLPSMLTDQLERVILVQRPGAGAIISARKI